MERDYRSAPLVFNQGRSKTAVLSTLVAITLLLGACGGSGNEGDGGDTVATAVPTTQGSAAIATATKESAASTESGAMTETVEAAASGNITEGTGAGGSEVAVITSTELITGTEVTTDITVSTDTTVIEQQLITTVITNTDVVSNVVNTTDSSTSSETTVITDEAQLTPESETSEAVTSTTGSTVQAGQDRVTGVPFAGPVDAQGKTMLVSTLLDSDFLTSDGEVSGEVQDMVIDTQTGQVLYLLLEYGGVLDVGSTDFPAPLNAFTLKDDGEFLLNIPPENLEQFPDVGNEWPQVDQANWDSDVRDFWTNEGFEVNSDPAISGTRVRRASELINAATSDAGMGAGTVHDAIVSLEQGRVVYALLSFENAAGDTEWYAVPISAFDAENADEGLTFRSDFDGSLLEGAPRFNMDESGLDRFLPDDFDIDWQNYWRSLTNP